jgi:hypothetical protein
MIRHHAASHGIKLLLNQVRSVKHVQNGGMRVHNYFISQLQGELNHEQKTVSNDETAATSSRDH